MFILSVEDSNIVFRGEDYCPTGKDRGWQEAVDQTVCLNSRRVKLAVGEVLPICREDYEHGDKLIGAEKLRVCARKKIRTPR